MAAQYLGYGAFPAGPPQPWPADTAGPEADVLSAQMAGISAQLAELRQMLAESVHRVEAQQAQAGTEIVQLRTRLLDILTLPAAPQRASRLDRLERLNRLYRRLESLEQGVGSEQVECVRMLEVVLSAVEKKGAAMGILSQAIGQNSPGARGRQTHSLLSNPAVSQPMLNQFLDSHLAQARPDLTSRLAAQTRSQGFSPWASAEDLRTKPPVAFASGPSTPQSMWGQAPQARARSSPERWSQQSVVQQPNGNANQQPITIVLDAAALVQSLGHTSVSHTARTAGSVMLSQSSGEAAPASPVAMPPPPRPAPATDSSRIPAAPHLTPSSLQGPSTSHRAPPLWARTSFPYPALPTAAQAGEALPQTYVPQRQPAPWQQFVDPSLTLPAATLGSSERLQPIRPYPTAMEALPLQVPSSKIYAPSEHSEEDALGETERRQPLDVDFDSNGATYSGTTLVTRPALQSSLDGHALDAKPSSLGAAARSENLHAASSDEPRSPQARVQQPTGAEPERSSPPPARRDSKQSASASGSSSGSDSDAEPPRAAPVHQPDSKHYSSASSSGEESDAPRASTARRARVGVEESTKTGKPLEVEGRLSSGTEGSSSSESS